MAQSVSSKFASDILSRYKLYFAGVFFLTCIAAGLNTSFGALLKWLADGLDVNKESVLSSFVILFCLQRFLLPIVASAATILSSRLANQIETDIRAKWYRFVVATGSGEGKGKNSGEYQKRVQEAVFSVRSLLNNTLRSLLSIALEILMTAVFAIIFISIKAGVILLLFAFAYSYFVISATKKRVPILKDIAQSDAKCAAFMHDSFINTEAASPEMCSTREAQHNSLLAGLQVHKNNNSNKLFGDSVISSVLCFGGALVILLGYHEINGASVGTIVMLAASLAQLIAQINTLGFNYRNMLSARIDIERISDGLSVAQPLMASGAIDNLNKQINTFEFFDLAMPRGQSDLPNLISGKIVIFRGKVNTLIGPSGVGKSTIARTIRGEIVSAPKTLYINGVDGSTISSGYLQGKVAYISQDNIIYNESIAQNLRYARKGVTDREIVDALIKVGLEEFAYKTDHHVGEKGTLLSGGERQRLVIARGLLQKCEILIIDEPFTGLDDERAALMSSLIKDIARQASVLVITHAQPNLALGNDGILNTHEMEKVDGKTSIRPLAN